MVKAFEDMLKVLLEHGFEPLEEKYISSWLHTKQQVLIKPHPRLDSYSLRPFTFTHSEILQLVCYRT